MVVGEQIAISTVDVAEFSEGVAGVVDFKRAQANPTNFVLLALAPGETSLLLIMRDGSQVLYQITVTAPGREEGVVERDNIRFDLYFVEIRSGDSYRAGLLWPGTAAGTGALQATGALQVDLSLSPVELLGAAASISAEILPRLDLAETAGWARVLRHASIATANGEVGRFSSGGEVNIKVANGFSVGLEQVEHGTKLAVTPAYDRSSGRIDVAIEAEVATLGDLGVDSVPGRNVTSVITTVNVALGQSIVLGGLVGESESKDRVGLPWLSRIPVFGYLFGGRSATREKTENILIIVPSVANAIEAGDRRLVDDALEAYRRGRFPAEAPVHLPAGGE
jgi:pilus assembly protein CpaC